MKLHECLTHAPYAVLLRISKHYAVPIGHDCRRARVLDRLLGAPLQNRIVREIALIDMDEQLRALQLLAHEGGHVERVAFERAFGPCLVPRSGAIDPVHVVAHLVARGIIFALADQVVLPEEFLPSIPPTPKSLPLLDQERPVIPLYDLAIMLVAAHRGALLLDQRDGHLNHRTITDLLPVCSPTGVAGEPPISRARCCPGTLARTDCRRRTSRADARHMVGARSRRTVARALAGVADARYVISARRLAARHDTCPQCPWLHDALARMLADGDD